MAPLHFNHFQGSKVRLAAPCPEDCMRLSRFTDDYGYLRNLDTDIAVPLTPDETGSSSVRRDNGFEFSLRTLEDNRYIGFTALYRIEWNNRSARLAIAIGDEKDRGKGYGSDALALIMRYGFHELNLNRIALEVIEYNETAMQAYLKAGFQVEGRQRSAVLRDGRHYDLISMSILAEEWSKQTELPLSFQSTRANVSNETSVNIKPFQRAAAVSASTSGDASEPLPTTSENTTVQPRIGVGAVIVNDRREVLLVWRNREPEQFTWSIPGGKIDPYESAETAVIREIKEEVNLDITIDRLLCTAETIQPDQQEHWISLLYSTRIIGGIARNLEEGGAIGEIGWFPLDDLPSPLACFAVPGLDAVKKMYFGE
ncbi:RimJ/RimL family protein N-acetyltransferase/ADP-ribose pyrophosphatase YjhB (NUDIX family) [Paenibacillus tundrae]|uniref:RimJ/RimL family protein N-acetyltransferase/ADP-ribose pyrophosphatase YjhB (NUDIX family) n=1 Tax=Paenibacillus tundrae TaxID=528187 RepID=A0ABT9WB67_9BACL|nr:RimJ/RimL family protein N-acetyltransferase/ADP-ribose pyrophosphatase YjhB (NUDIX family) [Paenibacillus tundrae]